MIIGGLLRLRSKEDFVSRVFRLVGRVQEVPAEIQNPPVVRVINEFEIQSYGFLSCHGLDHADTTNGYSELFQ